MALFIPKHSIGKQEESSDIPDNVFFLNYCRTLFYSSNDMNTVLLQPMSQRGEKLPDNVFLMELIV